MSSALADLWSCFAGAGPGDRLALGQAPRDQVLSRAAGLAGELHDAGVRAGESVGLTGQNDSQWVIGLLALTRAGARPLVLPADAPPAEISRLLRAAGAGRYLRTGASTTLAGEAGTTAGTPGTLLLPTSGSTGTPKIIERSQQSVLDEGLRYARAGLVTADDRVLLPLPVSHAYALGWLAGAIVVGAQALPVSPKALGTVQRLLTEGATVLVSVPGLARVLVRRKSFTDAAKPRLRMVMCGAGYVDEALDAQWRGSVGIGISRNYGSSETGAVLWGPPGLPSGCVGRPMPGVGVELAGSDGSLLPGAAQGHVVVVLEDGRTHPMGDLAERDADGNFTILGRTHTGVVRRGARWVSTLEVESILRATPGIADLTVAGTGTGSDDDQGLTAYYVPAGRSPGAGQALSASARDALAAHKVPDAFRPRYRLHRSSVGKILAEQVYYRAPTPGSSDEQRALVTVIKDLRLLTALAEGATVTKLADLTGLPESSLSEVMSVAHGHGVLTTTAPAGPLDADAWAAAPAGGSAAALARGIIAAARLPLQDDQSPGDDARAFLDDAAPGPLTSMTADVRGAALRAALRTYREAMPLEGPVLELSVGRPWLADADRGGTRVSLDRYSAARRRWTATEATRTGNAGCVVGGAVHGPADDLAQVASLLDVGGVLLVADLFAEGPQDPACVRWLAAGALSWWSIRELQGGLESVGCEIREPIPVGSPPDGAGQQAAQAWIIAAERK